MSRRANGVLIYSLFLCLFILVPTLSTSAASTKSTAPPSMVAPLTPGCPVCGTLKQSGKQSCCARGGAWFGNCGNPDDDGVDHTWSEGIQACTCKLAPNDIDSYRWGLAEQIMQ